MRVRRVRERCGMRHASTPSIRPERSRTMRSQRCASALSCVTSTSVVPRSTWPANSRSMICCAGGLVEIAGRLVGDQDRRIGRQRAGERDALLLAAGQLRRIVAEPLGQSDRGQFVRARGRTRRRRRRARAAPRRSPARSWSGSDGRTGTRCRHCGRESAPARPRRARRRSSPATTIEPVSGALQPGHHHQQRGLARAGRPDQADRLAASYMQVDVLEDMNPGRAAAEREIDAGERDGRLPCAAVEMSFMRIRRRRLPSNPRPAHMGTGPAWSSGLRPRSRLPAGGLLPAAAGGAAERPVKIVALGDSLTAGLPAAGRARRSRRSSRRALKAKGLAVEVANAGVSGDTASGGLAAARLVGAGRHRRGDRRARRQRHAARRRSQGDARGA